MKALLICLLLFMHPLDNFSQQKRRRGGGRRRAPQKQQQVNTKRNAPTGNLNTSNLELLDSNFSQWAIYLDYPEGNRAPYSAIYYNPSRKIYIHATIKEVLGSTYPTMLKNLQKRAKKEQSFTKTFSEQDFFYIGDTPQKERLFIHSTNTNRLYIKQFTPILDNMYTDNGNTSYTNKQQVYPVLNTLYEVQYTNKNGVIFNRLLQSKGELRLIGEVNVDRLINPKSSN